MILPDVITAHLHPVLQSDVPTTQHDFAVFYTTYLGSFLLLWNPETTIHSTVKNEEKRPSGNIFVLHFQGHTVTFNHPSPACLTLKSNHHHSCHAGVRQSWGFIIWLFQDVQPIFCLHEQTLHTFTSLATHFCVIITSLSCLQCFKLAVPVTQP